MPVPSSPAEYTNLFAQANLEMGDLKLLTGYTGMG